MLDVKKLPNNTFLIGDFKISENIDKKNLNVGEALNFDISIKGRGNIDDIPELKLDIANATVYDNKSVKTYDMMDKKYGGTYKKSYSIVANEDITIPSIVLKYFNKETHSVKKLKTKEYIIKVKKETQKDIQLYKQQNSTNNSSKQIIEKKIMIIETSDNQKLLYFFFGFITAVLLCLFIIYIKNNRLKNRQEELLLEKEIKKAKSENELLNVLLSYIKIDKDLDKMIFTLENGNINNIKQFKNEVIEIIKQNQIKN